MASARSNKKVKKNQGTVKKIINDPIHGVMTISEDKKTIDLLLQILDHPFFQRLRHIKQLGCGDFVFPGAVHTRFNHCIGACYLAKKFSDKLHADINEELKRTAMVAALVHDIGHGPFSHAFEKIYPSKKVIEHERWTMEFIKRMNIKYLKNINSYFDKNSHDYNTLVKDIISSQFDVDRLDYLLRDSYFCGVPYGKVDIGWIFNSLISIEIDNKKRLGISRKGVGAIEHYLIARRLMTRNVYYHGKKNAAEYCINQFLSYLMRSLVDNKSYVAKIEGIKNSNLGKFLLNLSDYINDVEEDKKENFISENFDYYSKLTDNDIWCVIEKIYELGSEKAANKKSDIYKLSQNLIERKIPKYYSLKSDRIITARKIIDDYIKKKNITWDIYIDDLKTLVSYEPEKEEIYVQYGNKKNTIVNICYESFLLNLLGGKKEHTYFLYIDVRLHGEKKINKNIKNLLQSLNHHGCLAFPLDELS